MKKPVVVLLVACLTVVGAGPLVLKSSADNLGFTLLTTPETPYGWTPTVAVRSGTTAAPTGSVEYTGGPRVPNAQGDGHVTPHGGGSLTLRTGGNQDTVAQMRNPYLDGAALSGIDIDYSFIAEQRPGANTDSGGAAPALQLAVTGPNGSHTLVYEPYFNNTPLAVPLRKWERDSAENGKWWRSGDPAQTLFTLPEYLATNPGAKVASGIAGGALAITAGAGSAEWKDFVGAVDDVLLKRDAANPATVFNFEPTILTVFPGSPQGWTFTTTRDSAATVDPAVSLRVGPGSPFFGTGSVEFRVGDKGGSSAEVRSPDLDGRTVAGIDALAYGTFVSNRKLETGCAEAPYLRLETVRVASPGAPATGLTLFFHPCDQTPRSVPLNTWQRWDAANGIWRWNEPLVAARANAPASVCKDTDPAPPDNPECSGTLTQYRATYPGDEMVASSASGSLRIGAGGGTPTNLTNPNGDATRWEHFVGNADFLTLDHSTTPGRDYDFEGQAPPPPATTTTTDPNATTTSTTVSSGPTTSTTLVRTTTTTTGGTGTTTTTTRATTTTTQPNQSASVRRLEGADRFDTAIQISQASFGTAGAGAVVLARGDDFPDALAATPLAVNRRGPLLLTWPSDLDARVENEIRRVLPAGGTVHIAGGPAAVGPGVEARLKADGFNVARHNGRNRFETATLIAEQISAPQIAFLATGTNFADALPSGAAAGAQAGVVLLTSGTSMPPETAAYLQARPGLRRVAVGGQSAAADPGAEPIVGSDRFETAVAVARRFFPSATSAAVANGTHFADALAGGPHVGSRGGPLLLTRIESLPAPARQWLTDNRSSLRNVSLYGGPNAVSANTENEIRTASS